MGDEEEQFAVFREGGRGEGENGEGGNGEEGCRLHFRVGGGE